MSSQMYCKNEVVRVFPIGFDRPKMDPGARALSERNLRYLVRAALDKPSFVITKELDLHAEFEFVIEGYYIKLIRDIDDLITFFKNKNAQYIYASIFIDDTNSDSPQLSGVEVLEPENTDNDNYTTNQFTGVLFSDSNTVESVYDEKFQHYLKILEWDSLTSSYIVPEDSKKYGESIIDGGEIE